MLCILREVRINNSKEYLDGNIYSDSHSLDFLSLFDCISVEMVAFVIFQKQPSIGVLIKRSFRNMRQI